MKVPVPLLVTAQDWDPRRQPVRDWLTGRLQQTYPLFAGRTGTANAAGLIDTGKITVILDGLDEIAADLWPVALQALSQASFRVVVLSRTAEMASAASQHGVLQGAVAVELRAIAPATAANTWNAFSWTRPREGWRDLTGCIRASPATPLTEALNNPLALTLIRDTYQSGDDARELLHQCDTIQQRAPGAQAAEEITGHLLDRVLPAAYAPWPGRPRSRYDLQTAQNALAKIAARMNQDGTRDLQWWHIPQWVPPAPRIIVAGPVLGLAAGIAGVLIYGLAIGLLIGIAAGIAAGIVAGLVAGLALWLAAGLVHGLVGGLVVGLAAGIAAGRAAGPVSGLAFGLVLGLSAGLVVGLGISRAWPQHSPRLNSPGDGTPPGAS